ncbi:hypothetical protein ACFQ4C_23930 [Larkinella insperata]|uniref:YD repeat-containing protein n=1 Tax=Larkinella insperata TaxID=332158 RepID=A0ABW3QLI5_9BACT|nr:hypothetical protein [Larkinella insperata]
MTTTRLGSGFVSLLLIFELFGCADHRLQVVTPGADRLRVKSITQHVSGSSSVSTVSAFSYDGQGRIRLIVAYQLPDSAVAPVENTVYQYDNQHRLTQVQHSTVRRGSATETYTLTYDNTGRMTQLTNEPSTFRLEPRYNSDNKVSSYNRGVNIGGLQSTGASSFTFTGNNLTRAYEEFSVNRTGGPSGQIVYSRVVNATYTFDDKINPFYGVFLIPAPGVFLQFPTTPSMFGPSYTLYGGVDNPYNLSQNNVLTAALSSGILATYVYNYTYNAANLPTTRTTTRNGDVTEILHYEYEPH